MAKGFGGKYFSLQAITATVNATTLHNRAVRTHTCHSYRSTMNDASIDESPPDELDILLEAIEPFTPKVSRCQCHCNCFFRRRTRCALYVSSLTPKLRFLFRYFHTDTSPPLPFSFSY
jgi:hypothetical protein